MLQSLNFITYFFYIGKKQYVVVLLTLTNITYRWRAQAALRRKSWKETIFKIIAGRINVSICNALQYQVFLPNLTKRKQKFQQKRICSFGDKKLHFQNGIWEVCNINQLSQKWSSKSLGQLLLTQYSSEQFRFMIKSCSTQGSMNTFGCSIQVCYVLNTATYLPSLK